MISNLTIDDLEKHSGFSKRTLHYYMQEGLLPGPETRGKYASYTQEHLDRLDLIMILKEMHLPLKEIRAVMDRLTPSEIVHYRDDQEHLLKKLKDVKPKAEERSTIRLQNSALDYIRGLEEAQTSHKKISDGQPFILNESRSSIAKKIMKENFSVQDGETPRQEIWRRIVLDDGIELNYRDTRDKRALYRIERLLAFARSLFENQEGSE